MTFDRFDIAAAYALYWSRYHQGQFTRGYARLCAAMRLLNGYCPSRLSDLSDNGREIYRALKAS